jgi:excisionase family DNA binding protein
MRPEYIAGLDACAIAAGGNKLPRWEGFTTTREGRHGMGLMDFIRGELIEIIEFNDDSRDTLAWRYPDSDREIKRGAQLIVRESQVAQFVYLGQFGDTFGPGKHTLVTDNIPVLSTLKGWKYGFDSPFKADVYYVNTRLFTGNKWGTSNPVMMRDKDFGVVRMRAFGTYDFRVLNPQLFLKEVVGTDHNFRLDEFADTMRSRVVSLFTDALATAQVPALDVASRYQELGDALLPLINPEVTRKYGISIPSFIVENVSVPPEVEQAIDKRSSMSVIGNLNDYVKYQMGQGMAKGGGGGGAGGTAAEMAVGFGIAQEMMRGAGGAAGGVAQPPPLPGGPVSPSSGPAGGAGTGATAVPQIPDLLTVPQVAQMLGVTEADVTASIEANELKARKIGTQHRITRAALDAFLAG